MNELIVASHHMKRLTALCRAQGWKCAYCPQKLGFDGDDTVDPTFDHVTPKSKKGLDSIRNGLAACHPCNNAKGNRLPTKRELAILERIYPLAVIELDKINKETRDWLCEEVPMTSTSAKKAKKVLKEMRRQAKKGRDPRFAAAMERGWERVHMQGDDMRLPRAYRPASLDYVRAEAAALAHVPGIKLILPHKPLDSP